MTRSKWFASFFGLLLLGAFFLYSPKKSVTGSALTPDGTAAAIDLQEEKEAFQQAPKGKRLEEFYKKESARVGSVDPNPKLTEQRLAAVASALSLEELDWLRDQALARNKEGDARFFSAYLIALAPGEVAVPALRSLALSPVPKDKNTAFVELERQIRGQAVEGLSRAKGNPAARDALLDVISQQEDEFLRDRAHRGIHSWTTGKPIEQQDQEALGKLLYEKK